MKNILHDHLTCVICSVLTSSTIQCFNGHIHCNICIGKMQEHNPTNSPCCSICRSRRGWARTKIAQDIAIASNTLFKCGIEGCNEMVAIDELDHHRLHCSHKKFPCPIGCDCEDMRFPVLLSHLLGHKRVRALALSDSINVITDPTSPSPMQVFLIDGAVLCIRCMFRPSRIDGVTLDVRAGIISNDEPSFSLQVTTFDMCNPINMSKTNVEIPIVDSHESIGELLQLSCFHNFTSETFHTITCVQEAWDRSTFVKRCPPEVYDADYELDSSRLVAYCVELIPRHDASTPTPLCVTTASEHILR